MTAAEKRNLLKALDAYRADDRDDWRARQMGDLARRHLQAAADRHGLTLAELISVLDGNAG